MCWHVTEGMRAHACRISEDRPKRIGRDKIQGLLFTAVQLEMGNLVGSGHKFAVVQKLPVTMQVDMRGRVIIFEFEHVSQLYRVEVRFSAPPELCMHQCKWSCAATKTHASVVIILMPFTQVSNVC